MIDGILQKSWDAGEILSGRPDVFVFTFLFTTHCKSCVTVSPESQSVGTYNRLLLYITQFVNILLTGALLNLAISPGALAHNWVEP